MTLIEYRDDLGKIRVKLTECPVCGEEFKGGVSRANHLLNEHGPAEFGLSPLDGP